MIKTISKFLFWITGWKGNGQIIEDKKCIVLGAPHTSSWDFIMVWLYYSSIGGTANFLIKKEAFFWPVGAVLKKMGGIPIDRSKGANVIRNTIQLFNEKEILQLALLPEGTRKKTQNWKAWQPWLRKSWNLR